MYDPPPPYEERASGKIHPDHSHGRRSNQGVQQAYPCNSGSVRMVLPCDSGAPIRNQPSRTTMTGLASNNNNYISHNNYNRQFHNSHGGSQSLSTQHQSRGYPGANATITDQFGSGRYPVSSRGYPQQQPGSHGFSRSPRMIQTQHLAPMDEEDEEGAEGVEKPRGNIMLLACVVTICCNPVLGFVAVLFAYSSKKAEDPSSSKNKAQLSLGFSISAAVSGVLVIALCVVLLVVLN